jgi:hypothetical protein
MSLLLERENMPEKYQVNLRLNCSYYIASLQNISRELDQRTARYR